MSPFWSGNIMHVPCSHQFGKPQVSRCKGSKSDCTGSLKRILDVPGDSVTSAQWDSSGGRLVLCNGVSVYLAEVQVTPMWGHISTAIIYATPPEQSNILTACASHQVYLLGAHSMEKRAKHVPGLLMLAVFALVIVKTHANMAFICIVPAPWEDNAVVKDALVPADCEPIMPFNTYT